MSMNAHHLSIGVFTKNRNKAFQMLDKLGEENKDNINRKVYCESGAFIELQDGSVIKWINPAYNARCYRTHKSYIDFDLKDDADAMMLIEHIGFLYTKPEDRIWF